MIDQTVASAGSRVIYFIFELGFEANAVMKTLFCSFGSRVIYFIFELGFEANAVMKTLVCSFGFGEQQDYDFGEQQYFDMIIGTYCIRFLQFHGENLLDMLIALEMDIIYLIRKTTIKSVQDIIAKSIPSSEQQIFILLMD